MAFSVRKAESSSHVNQALGFLAQGFTALLGQHVAIFVLDQSIQVKTGDALSNASLSNTQGHVPFNPLPEIPLEHGEANVLLLLSFVLLNDVENHEVVLVHGQEIWLLSSSQADTDKEGPNICEIEVFPESDMDNLFTLWKRAVDIFATS